MGWAPGKGLSRGEKELELDIALAEGDSGGLPEVYLRAGHHGDG